MVKDIANKFGQPMPFLTHATMVLLVKFNMAVAAFLNFR